MAPPAAEPLLTTVDDDMDTASTMEAGSLPRFDDSDDEDDYFEMDSDDSDPECEDDVEQAIFTAPAVPVRQTENDSNDVNISDSQSLGEPAPREPPSDLMELELVEGEQDERNVQRKLSHPSSPHSQAPSLHKDGSVLEVSTSETKVPQKPVPGPDKVRVVIKDTAYATYRAVLATPSSVEVATAGRKSGETSTRKEWLKAWEVANPGKPRPCSAKAVYRLADKLDLQDLKERAFQHIIKSLTVENVAYEVFSHFSAAFDDVRKVEISYFLEHWGEIRDSTMMRNVWQQIRLGRHPGFEEVWPLIATNLEYKSQDSPAGRDNEKA
ncbi:hypothetical protein EIP86_006527 [Pleurotus ostreatoroseus]|nr:hypothetical protein EIP86_006527 [Pleurotus ostreatoroseus]